MKKCLIFVFAVAFVAGCVLPAMAQEKEVTLYGSVRMETFARYFSKEAAGRGYTVGPPEAGDLDKSFTQFEIGDSSRFGARFKMGNTSANVELRPYSEPPTIDGSSSTGNMRQWWGQVDFTGWQLRVGQQSVLDGLFPPGCCIDEGSVQSSFGGWSGRVRQPGLAAFIPLGNGTFKFGLFQTGRLGDNASGIATAGSGSNVDGFTGQDVDVHIPQIQVSYDIKFGPAAVKFIGGYNTYNEVYWNGAGATNEVTESIDSFVLGGEVQTNFGPFTVMWQIHYAQNPSAYKGRASAIGLDPTYVTGTNSIEDVTQWGSFARFLYKMSDMITWELGGGYADAQRDDAPGLDKVDDDALFVYLNAQIFFTKTFRFTPEVGLFDLRTRTPSGATQQIEQGSEWYWGAYWRIDF